VSNGKVAVTPFDRHCWALKRAGRSPEDIAALMNAELAMVEAGVMQVERWMASNSREMVETAIHEQVIIAVAPIGKTLVEGQRARRVALPELSNPQTGEVTRAAVYEPDHATRIDAVRATATMVESVKAPASGAQVNIGINNAPGAGAGRSFESRVREKREQLGMNKPTQVAAEDVEFEEISG